MALSPDVLDWLQKQAQGAAPDAPAPTPDAAAPAAPPNPLVKLYSDYLESVSPARLREAQQADFRTAQMNRAGDVMQQASAIASGSQPVNVAPVPPMAVTQFGQRADLAGKNLGMAAQVMAMDPRSRVAELKRAAFATTDAGKQLAAAAGPGYANLSPWDLEQYQAGLKAGLEPSEALAKIEQEKAGAEKSHLEGGAIVVQNRPLSPETRAALARFGITVPEGTSASVAERVIGPQVTRLEGAAGRANALALKRMEIEQWRAQQFAMNPRAVAPGYHSTTPRMVPDPKDTEAFLNVYIPGVETVQNLEAYQAAWERAAKNPRLLADPSWRQQVTTLYESTFPAIAKKNAGGTSAPLAEIGAAQEALAKPGIGAQIFGFALPKVQASVGTLKGITKRDIDHVGKSHYIEPDAPAAAAETPASGRPRRTVGDETREWDGKAWVPIGGK